MKGGIRKMISCDNCNEDVTPDVPAVIQEEIPDYEIVNLNGGKKCLCHDCFIVLSDWACSDDHKKAVEEYKKNFEER